MKKIALFNLFTLICACAMAQAQIINYVKNPSFEDTVKCPWEINQISYAKYWQCAVDTTFGEQTYAPEYYNVCAGLGSPIPCGVPYNVGGFQYPRTGNAYIGGTIYYDKTPPPPAGVAANWRDYAQGHLVKPLQNGKTYCVSFWVVVGNVSGYAHDNIGAYFDNGNINKRSIAGLEITDVVPQVYSTSIIKDTMNWTKVEGSFVATGNETHITLGNFTKNIDLDTAFLYWGAFYQYSYYYIDDISVIPIDLSADAGADKWAEQSKQVQVGRVGDSTAIGLDCKWYHKGSLIDSGAIISVNANAIKGAIDTYIVVQNVCGNVTRDTVVVSTVGLGMQQFEAEKSFNIYPNPSSGVINISSVIPKESVTAKVYDLLGRVVHQELLNFSNKEVVLKLNIPTGSYILEVKDEDGNVQRERIVLE